MTPTMPKAELYCNLTLMGLKERLQDGILWQKRRQVIRVGPVVLQKFGQATVGNSQLRLMDKQ